MIHVTRHFGGSPAEYPIYTEEEARRKGLSYRPWKRALPKDPHEGEHWALSDDGMVVECIRRNSYPDSNSKERFNVQYTFTVGRPWVHFKKLPDGSEEEVGCASYHVEPYLEDGIDKNWSAPRPWAATELSESKRTFILRTAATLILARAEDAGRSEVGGYKQYRGLLTDEDWHLLGTLMRPSEEVPKATAKRWFKTEYTERMLAKELTKLLDERGITKADVIDRYEETYEKAKEEGHTGTMKSVADVFREMHDMSPSPVRREEAQYMEIDFAEEPPSEIEESSHFELPPSNGERGRDDA